MGNYCLITALTVIYGVCCGMSLDAAPAEYVISFCLQPDPLSSKHIFISDTNNNRIRLMDTESRTVVTLNTFVYEPYGLLVFTDSQWPFS